LFAENAIDFDIATQLSELDLKELGIPLGDRKRLLNGIATLDAQAVRAADEDSDSATDKAPKPQAERRQLTVMFVDLVGSTALSSELDPEDLRELMLGYQNAVAGEITRFEGNVAKYMGDGVLAYFGWPRAHEDEAERAVRAALAVTAAVTKLRTPADEPLTARVGMATGIVVVGDLIGAGAAREEAVVGETPNLAARLQALAEPGSVVISESTRRLCGAVFELQALGPQALKGIAEPVTTYQVLREQPAESRFQAQYPGTLLPLIGREHELAQLREHWQQACRGKGQMILLSGDAGIGKSRILRALGEALRAHSLFLGQRGITARGEFAIVFNLFHRPAL
jgi:class 3 adenylate cyclase